MSTLCILFDQLVRFFSQTEKMKVFCFLFLFVLLPFEFLRSLYITFYLSHFLMQHCIFYPCQHQSVTQTPSLMPAFTRGSSRDFTMPFRSSSTYRLCVVSTCHRNRISGSTDDANAKLYVTKFTTFPCLTKLFVTLGLALASSVAYSEIHQMLLHCHCLG